jgi:hypothetical protein
VSPSKFRCISFLFGSPGCLVWSTACIEWSHINCWSICSSMWIVFIGFKGLFFRRLLLDWEDRGWADWKWQICLQRPQSSRLL